jgi:hypothetical protein
MNTEQQQTEQQLILSIPKEIMDFHIIPNLSYDLKTVSIMVKLSKYADQTELDKLYLKIKNTVILPNLISAADIPTDKRFEKYYKIKYTGKHEKYNDYFWDNFIIPDGVSLRKKEGALLFILYKIKYAALWCKNHMNTPLDKLHEGTIYNRYSHHMREAYQILLLLTVILPNKKTDYYKIGYNPHTHLKY